MSKQESYFQIAAASRLIAPQLPVVLGCSDFNQHTWEGIESPIEANAVALWDSPDRDPVLFVTLDLLYPGQLVRSVIEEAARPLSADRIVVAASHTHRAPMTDDTKPMLGEPDAGYIQFLTECLRGLVKEVLFGTRKLAKLAAGSRPANHSINRRLRKPVVLARRIRFNEVVNSPNPLGAIDETVSVLTVQDGDGRPVAVIWNYACHPVDGPTRNAVSGHFPSHVRERIRSQTGNEALPVLFLQGFSGDTRPSESAVVRRFSRRLRRLIVGPLFDAMPRPVYSRWADGLAEIVLQSMASAVVQEHASISSKRIAVPASKFVRASRALADVTIARIDIGNQIRIVAVSGELVVEYARRLRSAMPQQFVIPVGCTDQVLGYIPTEEIVKEGGYEGGGFCVAFDLDGLQPDIEQTMTSAIRKVLL